jgi:plasmid stabilization system protein ParE
VLTSANGTSGNSTPASQFHEGKHVIFYRVSKQGTVEIIRVLHERMLPDLHF